MQKQQRKWEETCFHDFPHFLEIAYEIKKMHIFSIFLLHFTLKIHPNLKLSKLFYVRLNRQRKTELRKVPKRQHQNASDNITGTKNGANTTSTKKLSRINIIRAKIFHHNDQLIIPDAKVKGVKMNED